MSTWKTMEGTQCIPNMKISIPIFSNTKMVLATIKGLSNYWCLIECSLLIDADVDTYFDNSVIKTHFYQKLYFATAKHIMPDCGWYMRNSNSMSQSVSVTCWRYTGDVKQLQFTIYTKII